MNEEDDYFMFDMPEIPIFPWVFIAAAIGVLFFMVIE